MAINILLTAIHVSVATSKNFEFSQSSVTVK